MTRTKQSQSTEGNESNVFNEKNKGHASKTKRYISKKTRTKTQGPELESNNNFKGQCSDPEGYIFNLGQIASDNFYSTIKELERYLGATYRVIYQPEIMVKTPATLPGPEISKIIPSMGVERPKTDAEMT